MKKKASKELETKQTDEEKVETPFEILAELFESCLIEADWSELTKNFINLYDSHSDEFESYLEKLLMLTLKEVKRSSAISKIFRFVSECVIALDNSCKVKAKDENNEDEDEPSHPLLLYLLKSLKRFSESASYIVRFRSCQLLYAILSHMIDKGVGELDAYIYQSIANLALKRRLDVSATVRSYAVQLAKFFQDPTDHEDPVIAGLQYQMERDPNARVRQNIVEIIAVCEETIVPVYKRFLYDKSAQVRNSALLHISTRIGPRAFTTEQRIRILSNCFKDSSMAVRKNAVQKLIPMWLRAYNDEVLVFFHNLLLKDNRVEELPFADSLLLAFLKFIKLSTLIKEIKLEDESLLPSTLSAEKIFLWHRIYNLSHREAALKKFFPESEKLVDYFIEQLRNSAVEENQTVIFSELVMFLIDVMKTLEKDKCERILSTLLEIIKCPFVPNEVVKDSVALYFEYAALENDLVFDDLLQIIIELQKFANFMTGKEQKQIILKCLCILAEILSSPYVTVQYENITKLKDQLIVVHLNSDEVDIKTEAYKALSLYCLLDFEAAKKFWTDFCSGLYAESSEFKLMVLKGTFDLLFAYGASIFADIPEECEKNLNTFLENMLSHIEDDPCERDIIVKGILKLFLAHHLLSPELLSGVIKLMFHPNKHTVANDIDCFLEEYGKSKQETECLTRAFLAVIMFLFECSKTSGYYKVNIKNAALKLLEYAAAYEESKNVTVQDKFKDLLVLKLTENYIKKPSRLQITDLQYICGQTVPKDIDKLAKLKKNVKIIVEDLHFTQKSPYAKKSIKFFTAYLKNIQAAIEVIDDTAVESKSESLHDDIIQNESN